MNKFFRALNADEIECRINQISPKRLTLLLYKTARTDADILDETVGSDKWENDFKVVNGVLYGGLGVDYGNGLVWKWDAGTESNMEAEKGRASDAFKRAGFKHGIGRELYSAPTIVIYANAPGVEIKTDGKAVCYNKFEVTHIAYNDQGKISELKISCDGTPCYSWPETRKEFPTVKDAIAENICERCGKPIKAVRKNDGTTKSVDDILNFSRDNFDADYCASCCTAMYKAKEQNENPN